MAEIELPDGNVIDFPDQPTPADLGGLRKLQAHFAAPKAPAAPTPAVGFEVPEVIKETGRVADQVVRGGVTALPRFAIDLAGMGAKAIGGDPNARPEDTYSDPSGAYSPGAAAPAPNADAPKNLFPPISEPQSGVGKVIGTLGEGAVSAIAGPGGLARPLLAAGVGASSAGAADLTQRTTENPILAAAAGIGTGLLGGLAGAVKGTSKSLAQRVAGDIPEADLLRGKANMQEAADLGVTKTLSQALPDRPELQAAEDFLANNSAGRKLQDTLRAQPAQAEQLVQRQLDKTPGTVGTPREVENAMQEAATGKLVSTRKEASTAFREELNKTGGPTQLKPETVDDLDGILAKMAKDNPGSDLETLADRVRGKLFTTDVVEEKVRQRTADGKRWEYVTEKVKTREPLTDPEKLKQAINDTLDGFSKRELNDTSKSANYLRYEAKIMEAFKGALAKDSPEMKAAASAYARIMEDSYNPLKKSVVGRVAGVRGAVDTAEAPGGRTKAIFDAGRDPNLVGKSEITQLGEATRETPGVFADAWKTYFSGEKAAASNASRAGEQAESFIDTMTRVVGDPRVKSAKSAGTEDALTQVALASKANPKELIDGWQKAAGILSDLTRRPNKMTSIEEQELAQAAKGAFSRVLARVGIWSTFRQPGEVMGQALSKRAFETLSDSLTSPEGVDMLIKLSRKPAHSHAAVTTLATFLGTNAGLQAAARDQDKE